MARLRTPVACKLIVWGHMYSIYCFYALSCVDTHMHARTHVPCTHACTQTDKAPVRTKQVRSWTALWRRLQAALREAVAKAKQVCCSTLAVCFMFMQAFTHAWHVRCLHAYVRMIEDERPC